MADERNARLVSGEIMTDSTIGQTRPFASAPSDIVDAEVMTVISAERSMAGGLASHHSAHSFIDAAPPIHGMDTLRLGRAIEQPPARSRGGPLFWVLGVVLVAGAFWMSGGHVLIRRAVNVTAEAIAQTDVLRISLTSSRIETTGGGQVLFVEGEAINETAAAVALRQLEIRVTGNDGVVTRYNLGTSGQVIQPAERITFSSRLAAPKNGVQSVSVVAGE